MNARSLISVVVIDQPGKTITVSTRWTKYRRGIPQEKGKSVGKQMMNA
jgi:hypothetical protein